MSQSRTEWLIEAEAIRIGMAARGWTEVTRDEQAQAVALATRDGAIFNGCTDVGLRLLFGQENVHHFMGLGWFRKVI